MRLGGFLIIFACLFVGQAVIMVTNLPLPASIIGLLILFVLLSLYPKLLTYVQGVAQVLLAYLAFMVVPACIAIVQYLGILKDDGLAVIAASLLSTLLVLFVTSYVHTLVRKALKWRSQ